MNQETYSSGSAARKECEDNLVRALTAMDKKMDRKKKRRFAPVGDSRSLIYLSELQRIFSWRYGCGVLPDDDAGHDDLRMLVAAAKAAGKPAIDFVRKWMPSMPVDDARRFVANVDYREAYINADERARRVGGVTYAIHQMLHLREIGSIDVDKAGREKFRRARYDAKRRLKAAEKPPKPDLSPRELALIKMVKTGIGMGDLARKAARSKLFSGIDNVPLEVRRVVKRLVDRGILGQRLEPSYRGGNEYYLWNEHMAQAEESALRRALVENAPRETPIFKGSNRGAFACVIPPEGGMEKHDRDGLRFGRGGVVDRVEFREHAPYAGAAGRYDGSGMERRVS